VQFSLPRVRHFLAVGQAGTDEVADTSPFFLS
jgi:hypothetical protein